MTSSEAHEFLYPYYAILDIHTSLQNGSVLLFPNDDPHLISLSLSTPVFRLHLFSWFFYKPEQVSPFSLSALLPFTLLFTFLPETFW